MPQHVRRLLKATLSVLFFMFLFAACSSDGYPTSYQDQQDPETGLSNVEANWMAGCAVAQSQLPAEDSNLAEDANAVCECSYRRISSPVADGGIAFEEFLAVNDDLNGDPRSLKSETLDDAEKRIVEIVKNCIAEG